MPPENEAKCNSCGQCVSYCPEGGAHQELSGNQTLEKAFKVNSAFSDNLVSFLKSRRSYRSFAPRPVSKAITEQILETVTYAPSGGNNRLLRWIVIDNLMKTKKLSQMIAHWFDTDCRNNPVLSKRYNIDSILERYRAGRDPILRKAPAIAFTVGPKQMTWGGVDSGIALTYFNLAAEALDIGCCFCGYGTNAAKFSQEIKDYLGIGENEECYCAICYGHKTIHAHRIPARPEVPVTFI